MTCWLTVLTSIHLKSESNPPSGVPVKRNQTKIARYLWVFKFILDHSVSITVAWKNLELQKNMLSCLISKIILKQFVHTNSTFAILKKNGDSTLSNIKLIIIIDPNCRPPKQNKTNGRYFTNHLPVTIQWDPWLTHKQPYTPNINKEGRHCTTFVWASVWVVCLCLSPYLRACVMYWCGSTGENCLLCQHIIVILSDLRGWDGWAAKR